MIYGCSQPRELWFIDFNHVHAIKVEVHVHCGFNAHIYLLTRARHTVCSSIPEMRSGRALSPQREMSQRTPPCSQSIEMISHL